MYFSCTKQKVLPRPSPSTIFLFLSYLLGFLFSNLLSVFVAASGSRIVPAIVKERFDWNTPSSYFHSGRKGEGMKSVTSFIDVQIHRFAGLPLRVCEPSKSRIGQSSPSFTIASLVKWLNPNTETFEDPRIWLVNCWSSFCTKLCFPVWKSVQFHRVRITKPASIQLDLPSKNNLIH